jgi:hypothetical protein
MPRTPANKGKRRFNCTHPGCTTYGYLSVMEASCLDGIPYMCEPHDDQRTIRENCRLADISAEREGEQRLAGRI